MQNTRLKMCEVCYYHFKSIWMHNFLLVLACNVNHYLRVLFPRLLTWKCDHYGAPWIKKFVNLLVVWPCRLHYFSYFTKGPCSFFFLCSATFALRQILGWKIILLANLGHSRRNCFCCLACWLCTWTAGAEIWFFHPKVCL